jgi:ribosomal protein L11 methylase PrmA
MPRLVAALHKGGQILFSGLLVDDENDIRQLAAENGLLFVNRKERNGWISLLFTNNS